MFDTILPAERYKGPNAYAALKLLQADVGSQEPVKIVQMQDQTAYILSRGYEVIAMIDDINSRLSNVSSRPLGYRAVVGNGKDAFEALTQLRDEIVEIGGGLRPGEKLVLGKPGVFHTNITLTP